MNIRLSNEALVLSTINNLVSKSEVDCPTPKMSEQCGMQPLEAVSWQVAAYIRTIRNRRTTLRPRKLLTYSSYKLQKADGVYKNVGLTLSSASEGQKLLNVKGTNCAFATVACKQVCVGANTGQGRLPSSKIARIGRWIMLQYYPIMFWTGLDAEFKALQRTCRKNTLNLMFRPNVASDLPELSATIRKRYPWVHTVYDYTAIPSAVRRDDGVRRVYSRKDRGPLAISGKRIDSERIAIRTLQQGYGVAVVANIGKYDVKPASWRGYPVVDGDVDDLWVLRAPESGPFVVMLYAKGTNAQKREAIDSEFAVTLGG